ncbi:MAG: hypothetical protein SGBAC_006211 [Bacillariaceae sp.]
MGQASSSPRRKKKKKSKKSAGRDQDASLLKLEEKIAMVKQDLIRTKQMGEVGRRTQEDDIYKCEMELYKQKYQLHKRGQEAKQYLSFWDYVETVNSVLHTDSSEYNVGGDGNMTLEQHKAALAKAQRLKAEKGTLAKHSGHFNVYSFFEAFLLRRLHIAMILKHQRAKQSDVWNDVIMFMYNMMPGMKKRNQAAREKYTTLKPESNETMRSMIKLQKKKIKLYEQMVENLKAEIEEEEMASSLDNDQPLVVDADEPPNGAPTETVDTSVGEDVNMAKFYQKGRYNGDDDEMSFKSFSSRKSRSKRRATAQNSAVANSQAPRWMKSSRNKLSKASNRDLDSSHRSNRSNRSPSPGGSPMASPLVSPNPSNNNATEESPKEAITDDDIERFLYPNKPIRQSGGAAARRRKASGQSASNRGSLPSELEFDQDGTSRSIVSALHDDGSIGSGLGAGDPTTLAEAKLKKKELDNLIETMEGEEDEEAIASN